jgi:hypothetical protein
MNDQQHPIYLAKFNARPGLLRHDRDLDWDAQMMTVFRSVLMRPEHLDYVPVLHERVVSQIAEER